MFGSIFERVILMVCALIMDSPTQINKFNNWFKERRIPVSMDTENGPNISVIGRDIKVFLKEQATLWQELDIVDHDVLSVFDVSTQSFVATYYARISLGCSKLAANLLPVIFK